MDNCGPGNILQESVKKTNRSKVEALETKNAQLTVQVAAMTRELVEKNEEIPRYQAEQTVVLNRVQDLVGNLGEVVTKAQMYDKLMKTEEPSLARKTLQILVKYSRMMKDLLKEI